MDKFLIASPCLISVEEYPSRELADARITKLEGIAKKPLHYKVFRVVDDNAPDQSKEIERLSGLLVEARMLLSQQDDLIRSGNMAARSETTRAQVYEFSGKVSSFLERSELKVNSGTRPDGNGYQNWGTEKKDDPLSLLEEAVKERLSPGLIKRANAVLKDHGKEVRLCREYGHGGGFCGAPDCWLRP